MVRILYLSPGFPPKSHLFCVAAHARGASVLAVGDVPESSLPPGVCDALDQGSLSSPHGRVRSLLGVVTAMVARARSRSTFVESNGEHWLEVGGAPAGRPLASKASRRRDVRRLRSKLAMAEAFEKAGRAASAPGHPLLVRRGRSGDFRASTAFPSSSSPTAVRAPTSTFRCRPTPSRFEAAPCTSRRSHRAALRRRASS
jgi:hypothetical protein